MQKKEAKKFCLHSYECLSTKCKYTFTCDATAKKKSAVNNE